MLGRLSVVNLSLLYGTCMVSRRKEKQHLYAKLSSPPHDRRKKRKESVKPVDPENQQEGQEWSHFWWMCAMYAPRASGLF